MNIKETILNYMEEEAYKPMNLTELSKIFSIKKNEKKEFRKLLDIMEGEGLIIKNRSENFGVPERMGLVIGKLQGNQKGFGFLITSDDSEDIFIPLNAMNGAMNGDKVIGKITSGTHGTKKCEGEIVRIVERANITIIGIYEDNKNFGFVVPNDKRITQDIFVPKAARNGAKSKDVVIVNITLWGENRRNPEGEIISILGKTGDKGIDILSIIKEFKLPEEFSQKVLDYAESIPEKIPEEEYKKRIDLRDINTVTIDGEDAKDLDDAVSIKKLENGNYYLGVHIADVSNYVRSNNTLDKEALYRGTSVYLIDRVIPMLPQKLSNGICSLNPKVDRLTLSCFMEIDKNGKVVDHKIFESIIRTNERMTYTNVTKIIRDKDEELIKRYDYLYSDFLLMEELFNVLNKRRMKRGTIDFDFQESKIILDENGKPIDILAYERAIANKIIEEFMLVCNETVAEHFFWANIPFVYRIHEEPNEEKLTHFNEFAHNLGYSIKWGNEIHPKALQKVIKDAKGKPEETIVSTLLLRSMKQAKYSSECVGHFGLAAKYYCHFTSPIRRYPDLMIHRIIKMSLNGKIGEKEYAKLEKDVEFASVQSSERERLAEEAEREVDDLKKAEYMKERIGEIYDGIISSVTGFGIFVELHNTVEGLVHISALDDDYYIYDENHLTLTGERTKKIYKIGDSLKIKVTKVDLVSHEVYFGLEKQEELDENHLDETKKIDLASLISSEDEV
ncbi:MAG: ribonuclease R [Clostridiaceae bacterium]